MDHAFLRTSFYAAHGVSAFLYGEKKGEKALTRFLFTRGLFLIFLELTFINFGWNFNIRFPEVDFLVMWSLGFSMIILALLIHLPKKWVLVIGIILVAGHNLLDTVHVQGKGFGAFVWALLHERNEFMYGSEKIFVYYPVIPWIGIIALGYSLGSLYAKGYDGAKRRKILLRLGVSAILLFIIIRMINVYGDLVPWSRQSSAAFTILSFINVTKYPPSLLYTLMTVSCGLLFLAFSEKPPGRIGKFFLVFGRVPMFYYILHIYLIHLLGVFSVMLSGHPWTDMIYYQITENKKLIGFGFPLVVVYFVWIAVVIILYPLCKKYDRYKVAHREKWWLSYL